MQWLLRYHKWAGLAQAVFLLCVVAMMGNLTAATVTVMLAWYQTQPSENQDRFLLFKLNLVNFLSWMMFALFGAWLVPWIQSRVSRFTLLCVLTMLTLGGCILQGLLEVNYYCLFTAAILLSCPEPLLMSNLLVWIQQTVEAKRQNQYLSLIVMVVYGSAGVGYLLGLLVLPTPADLNRYWLVISIVVGWTLLIVSTFFLTFYRISCEEAARRPLEGPEGTEAASEPPLLASLSPCRRRFRFGVYLYSSAVMAACGVIVPAILAQLYADVGTDANTTVVGSIVYGILPTLICLPIGWWMDAHPPEEWIFWLPFLTSALQVCGLIGAFYISQGPISLTTWLCIFGFGNTPGMIVYLPTITRLSGLSKSFLNRMILWCSSLLISLSILVLLLGSVQFFGPVLVSLSLLSLFLLMCT